MKVRKLKQNSFFLYFRDWYLTGNGYILELCTVDAREGIALHGCNARRVYILQPETVAEAFTLLPWRVEGVLLLRQHDDCYYEGKKPPHVPIRGRANESESFRFGLH